MAELRLIRGGKPDVIPQKDGNCCPVCKLRRGASPHMQEALELLKDKDDAWFKAAMPLFWRKRIFN